MSHGACCAARARSSQQGLDDHDEAAITGLTEDTSPAEDDFLVTFDTSASALKKVAKSNISAAVSFSVNDNMPLTLADASSDPIQFSNVGTSATDLDVVLADGSTDPINITGTSNSATVFRDGDTDTFIRVESSNSDNDEIEIHTAGTERLKIDATAADFSVPVKLPNLTTTQRDALTGMSGGEQIFNTTTSKVNVYDGSSWTEVGGGSSGLANYFILGD